MGLKATTPPVTITRPLKVPISNTRFTTETNNPFTISSIFSPCLILSNIILSRKDADANVLVVPADHYIPDLDIFSQQMRDALEFADNRTMITAGIKPHMPHTGYGYINFDESRSERLHQTRFFKVKAFREKPKLARARQYVKQGNYCWNSGMFVYKLKFFREFLEEYSSYYAEQYEKLEKTFSHRDKFKTVFNRITPESIDFALIFGYK